jgi:hypothetical protein
MLTLATSLTAPSGQPCPVPPACTYARAACWPRVSRAHVPRTPEWCYDYAPVLRLAWRVKKKGEQAVGQGEQACLPERLAAIADAGCQTVCVTRVTPCAYLD